MGNDDSKKPFFFKRAIRINAYLYLDASIMAVGRKQKKKIKKKPIWNARKYLVNDYNHDVVYFLQFN